MIEQPPAETPVARFARGLMLVAAAAVPLSLLWDYSWESTVGVDLVNAPPHVATYASVALAALAALALIPAATSSGAGVRLWKVRAPLGAWVILWGALAFVAAFLFDLWWQAGYGLSAGIWHPPQIGKAVACFAIACGAWWCVPGCGAGIPLAMVATVTLASNFANLQHGAGYHQIACGTYPFVLAAAAVAGNGRFPATRAALACMALHAAAVWILPLVPGSPQTGPIYNPRDTLLPPPFPPLLVFPALALDWLLRPRGEAPRTGWRAACEAGVAFFVVFVAVQWPFASFLLSPRADNWFFAGGGRHWPVFMPMTPENRITFWPGTPFDLQNAAIALALACGSARLGLWLGAWLGRVKP
jgi:hypothetical protein